MKLFKDILGTYSTKKLQFSVLTSKQVIIRGWGLGRGCLARDRALSYGIEEITGRRSETTEAKVNEGGSTV